MANCPVTGSVALTLFTSSPLWDGRAPFMLSSPSGPLTTPGTRGSASWKRSLASGALLINCCLRVAGNSGRWVSSLSVSALTVSEAVISSRGRVTSSVRGASGLAARRCVVVRKPAISACTRYSPAATAARTAVPVSSVVCCWSGLRAWLNSVTLAPGKDCTSPEGSVYRTRTE